MRVTVKAVVLLSALAMVVGCGDQKRTPLPHEQELYSVHTVAVVPFSDAPGAGADGSGETVVNAVIAAVYKCPDVRVVERSRLSAIMSELDLQGTDLVQPANAQKVSQKLGADALIMGDVTQYHAQQDASNISVYGIGGGGTSHTQLVGLSLRVVDLNGNVIYTGAGDGKSKSGFADAAGKAADKAVLPFYQFCEYRRTAANTPTPAPTN